MIDFSSWILILLSDLLFFRSAFYLVVSNRFFWIFLICASLISDHFEKEENKTKAVLKNVVQMCSDLGMHALTEGVETVQQSMYLNSIGCERLQGYLFGKPMPLDEILMKMNAGTLLFSEEFIND